MERGGVAGVGLRWEDGCLLDSLDVGRQLGVPTFHLRDMRRKAAGAGARREVFTEQL